MEKIRLRIINNSFIISFARDNKREDIFLSLDDIKQMIEQADNDGTATRYIEVKN